MSDKFSPLPLPSLLSLTLSEIRCHRFLGLPENLFFIPGQADPFRMERYGQWLETPVGVAAGPHTQLAQNIIAAWLCGARYIELKTVQTLDDLCVAKPCIDMQDEGYNCEWSQELGIRQSFSEYLNAWIIIHILRHEMGFTAPLGTIFNMSAGYNLEGIKKDNVQWFLSKMQDCSPELTKAIHSIRQVYPAIGHIEIPSCISGSITLSTMHGCPPDEIEKIGSYLLREKKLHTTIKLNPTLLGKEDIRNLLNGRLGFTAEVPDAAFDHDLKYPEALTILKNLQASADAGGLQFGVKLTNTLECINNRPGFDEKESMIYMSGRALHPISVKLAEKLQNDFNGKLDISFSGGVDCFNIAEVLSCGLKPVTVCSDLLKPGGYGRLRQYFTNLRTAFEEAKAGTIGDYIRNIAGRDDLSVDESALLNLERYAGRVADAPAYHKNTWTDFSVKTGRQLDFFDCIHAPCTDTCPASQDIPEYMAHTASGSFPEAFDTIFRTNPFPSVTGMICDQPCRVKCTRVNYDEPLAIRDIKRFIAESHHGEPDSGKIIPSGKKVAVIGAGPAGLSCAWYLRLAGCDVDIFEQKKVPGGMVSAAIPSFRLTGEAVERDIQRILASGVQLHDNHTVGINNFDAIRKSHDAVFLAVGAQTSAKLNIEGIDSGGVLDPLKFLAEVKESIPTGIGKNIVIIGGGNTAMDTARTAFRLTGRDGKVTILYRRTRKEMPADKSEIRAALEEGIEIMELANPERIISHDGRVTSIICSRNIPAMKGVDGRPVPIKVPGSEFEVPCDTVIPAIGQQPDIRFLQTANLKTFPGSCKTSLEGVFIGGDAIRGASTVINAIADGRKAAAEILDSLGLTPVRVESASVRSSGFDDLVRKKATRIYGISPKEIPTDDRKNFKPVIGSLTPSEAMTEASRCLQCDELCNTCVSVCPNLANFSYSIEPVHFYLQKAVLHHDGQIRIEADEVFTVSQRRQVLNIRDFCNECGNCDTFCPASGSPYRHKPGLCLSAPTLVSEEEGYLLSRLPGRDVLIYKHHEHVKTLTLQDNHYIFETDQVWAVINPGDFSLKEVRFLTPCVRECRFTFAAEMSVIMQGAMQLKYQITV